LYALVGPPIRATCPTQRTLLNITTLIKLYELYKR